MRLLVRFRRAVISVPSNIAEGFVRKHQNEFKQHLNVAIASLAEAETQLILASRLGYFDSDRNFETFNRINLLGKMMTKFRQTL